MNIVNSDLQEKQKNGLKIEDFFLIVARYAKLTFTAEDRKNSKDIENILKKTDPSISYSAWMKNELGKTAQNNAEIERNDKIISGIIPTYSELKIDDSIFDKNRITLTDIVTFVENDLLKKHELTSYSTVGFNGLSFEKQQAAAINIGSYKIPLELSGTNEKLLTFIQTIQDSGQITVENGKLKAPQDIDSQAFSNLLMTIENMSFMESLEKPEKENKVNVNLVFYARAKSFSDLLKIVQRLSETTKGLIKSVDEYTKLCGNLEQPVCKNDNSLKAIQSIRSIADPLRQLDTQLDASLKTTTTQDVNGEFNRLVTITTTLNSLNDTFEKNKAIIESSKTQSNSKQ